MIVIGSNALACHLGADVPVNDLDLVATYEEAQAFTKEFRAKVFYPINSGKTLYMKDASGFICEVEIAWPGSRAEGFLTFAETHPEHFELEPDSNMLVPSLDVLYMLKMSHRYLKDSPHFLKTMRDIQKMRELGCEITEDIHPYYLKRMAETYTYAHPKLNVSKDGFFDSVGTGVPYVYDHDSIHEAVKVFDRPAYTFFKPEDSEVLCDKGMFFASPLVVQLAAVYEESCVLALERSLIPYPNGKTAQEAFDMALMKVCTSITSGWFREFAWENYDAVQAFKRDYEDQKGNGWFINMFEHGLASGVVKPFTGEVY